MTRVLIAAALVCATAFAAAPASAGVVHDGSLSFGYVDLPPYRPGAQVPANCTPWQAEPAKGSGRRDRAKLERDKLDHAKLTGTRRATATTGAN